MPTAKKCSDIPDRPILEFLRDLPVLKHGVKIRATWFPNEFTGMISVRNAMPNGEEIPRRLVLAKMRGLINRGLVDGCACGCRGEFELTPKGAEYLEREA